MSTFPSSKSTVYVYAIQFILMIHVGRMSAMCDYISKNCRDVTEPHYN